MTIRMKMILLTVLALGGLLIIYPLSQTRLSGNAFVCMVGAVVVFGLASGWVGQWLRARHTYSALQSTEAPDQLEPLTPATPPESAARWQTVFNAVQAPILLIEERTREVVEANPAALALLGCSPEQLLGKSCHQHICPAAPGACPLADLGQPMEHAESTLLAADGRQIPVAKSISRISLDGVSYLLETFVDISEQTAAKERLNQLAYHDPLTGLPNRLLFTDRLGQALARAHRNETHVALLLLDLDGFKAVNDTFGHDSGDALLRLVAMRLSGTVRGSDSICRIGGDEFTIILPDLMCARAVEAPLQRYHRCFSTPFLIAGEKIDIAASIGISVAPQDGADIDALFKSADRAMYAVKARGGNGHQFFTAEMREAAEQEAVTAR